jgi:hypothetical protein
MDISQIGLIVIMALFVLAVLRARRKRPGGATFRGPGAGATGAIYDMLNEDKRRAIEIIVEQKAEERDPETADGNLPELESPEKRTP